MWPSRFGVLVAIFQDYFKTNDPVPRSESMNKESAEVYTFKKNRNANTAGTLLPLSLFILVNGHFVNS